MTHQRDLPEDELIEEEEPKRGEILSEEALASRAFRTPLGARRQRRKDGPTFAEDVQRRLDQIASQGGSITQAQELKRERASTALPRPDIFRFASGTELQDSAIGLATRMKRGATPSESDLNAALVMIMDAEEQRRILFEQRSGVRTPDPVTGISSLDSPDALRELAQETGVGARESTPSFTGNIRAFFNLP